MESASLNVPATHTHTHTIKLLHTHTHIHTNHTLHARTHTHTLTTPSTHTHSHTYHPLHTHTLTHLPPPPLTHKHTVSYTSQIESSHRDSITCLDACPKLRLFASSSLDSTVRVWSDDNHPVRVLCLDYPPTGLAFCSTQAHIMIAIHSHLHIINNTECE